MLPATRPSQTMVFLTMRRSAWSFLQCSANAARSSGSFAVKAAMRIAATSRCWSKTIGRSLSITSRRETSVRTLARAPSAQEEPVVDEHGLQVARVHPEALDDGRDHVARVREG